MSFRGGGRNRGGPARNRGRFRGHSRERSLSRERMRHRIGRSHSRERRVVREHFASPPRKSRMPRGRSFDRDRFRSPPREHPPFEENYRAPRFEPREDIHFEYPNMEMAPMENFERMDVMERERERGLEPIEMRRGSPGWRVQTPTRKFSPERGEMEFGRGMPEDRKEIRYSPNVFEGKDVQDKPDPWTSNSSGMVIPAFGQEKNSSSIPEYNPENSQLSARTFLKQLEKVADEQKWSSQDKKFHFSAKLAGSAKEWFVSDNRALDSWSQIRKSFLRAFPSEMEYYTLLDAMMKRTKSLDEDLSTYFNYKMVLLNNCKITGRKAVSCLIGGLHDGLQGLKEKALEYNFSTPEELYEYLKDKDVDSAKKNLENPETTKKRKCYRCGDYGHIAFDCPKNRDMIEKPPKHIKEDKLPKYKDVSLFGWLTKAIFDDSCPHITIRESDLENLKIKYKRQVSIIDGCNGMKLTSLGQVVIHLKVDLLIADVDVHIVKDQTQTVPIILGKAMRRYAHYIEDRNGVHFSPLEKGGNEGRRRSLSPNNRKETRNTRSPNRHVASPRNFKESHPFLSKFYGNPYS